MTKHDYVDEIERLTRQLAEAQECARNEKALREGIAIQARADFAAADIDEFWLAIGTRANRGSLTPAEQAASLVRELDRAEDLLAEAREALAVFAAFADPRGAVPAGMAITHGSAMAKRQLTMGDCYAARAALARLDAEEPKP